MDKCVLLFSRDPGGANTVIPLVGPLTSRGYAVKLYGKDIALRKYAENGLAGTDIMKRVNEVSEQDIHNFLQAVSPDVVITGTSADDMTEKLLWKAAGEMGIPSMAILDQWVNYGIRFSRFSLTEQGNYEKERTHEYLPTEILVMDSLAKKESISDGLPESRIVITGSPYFETLIDRSKRITPADIQKVKSDLGLHGMKVITFASEPLSKVYKETDCSPHFLGYNERTILKELLSSLQEIQSRNPARTTALVIRLHPKQEDGDLVDLTDMGEGGNIRILFDRSIDGALLIAASDLICGMSSMFLIESFIMKKPVVSIQIGLNRKNPFVLDRMGALKSVLTQNELRRSLEDALNGIRGVDHNYRPVANATAEIINEMERVLCRN